MEKRLVLAMVLTAFVLVVIPRLFHTPPVAVGTVASDSASGLPTPTVDSLDAPAAESTQVPRTAVGVPDVGVNMPSVPAETTLVVPPAVSDSAATSVYRFVNQGATLVGVELLKYRALTARGGNVQMARE